jgi:hypothetical protein
MSMAGPAAAGPVNRRGRLFAQQGIQLCHSNILLKFHARHTLALSIENKKNADKPVRAFYTLVRSFPLCYTLAPQQQR